MASCDVLGHAPHPNAPDRQTRPFVNLVRGAIGSGAATPFLTHLRQLRIPDPEAVLKGQVQVDTGLREDELMTLFGAMAGLLLQAMNQNASQAVAYAERYLQGALRVAEAGKPDALYMILRRLVREGHLHRIAQRNPEVKRLLQALSHYYGDITQQLEHRL